MLLNKTFTKQVRSRIALAAGGALALIPTALDWFPRPAGLAIVALLVVASEIVGRHLFYASYARSGL
jgi:DMSO reductase anchor subunit